MVSTLFMLALFTGPSFSELKTFTLPENSPTYLQYPYDMRFAPSGELFVVDGKTALIHVWDEHGTYLRSFGGEGEGPGEMYYPAKLDITTDTVWVWDVRARLSRFDYQGTFIDAHHMPNVVCRKFAVLDDAHIVVAHKLLHAPTDMRYAFSVIHVPSGKIVKEVMDFKNEGYLAPRENDNRTTVKAYGPDVELQRDEQGRIWAGFSQERTLYRLDNKGDIAERQHFALPAEKPSADEEAHFRTLSLSTLSGGRVNIKELKRLQYSFEYDKAYYTHFMFHGDQVVFASTPIGNMLGVGNGYASGSLYVADRKSRQLLSRSRFSYAEDSAVLFQNGRIVLFLVNPEGEWEIKELNLNAGQGKNAG